MNPLLRNKKLCFNQCQILIRSSFLQSLLRTSKGCRISRYAPISTSRRLQITCGLKSIQSQIPIMSANFDIQRMPFSAEKEPPEVGKSMSSQEARKYLANAERAIMNKVHMKNQTSFRTSVIICILSGAWLSATFGKQLYSFFTVQTAEVLEETLRQESLQVQTQELATAVVQTLLNDEEVMRNAASFLREAAGNNETRTALVGLAIHILQHPDTLKEAVELGRKVVVDLAKEPSVINNISILMTEVLKDDRVKESASDLVKKLTEEEEVNKAIIDLTKRVLADESVNAQVVQLLSKSSFSVLEDKDVISHSKEFITEVVGDDDIQKTGGKALWKTIYYSMQPHLKKVVAGSLVCTSVIIFSIIQNNKQ